MLKTRYIHENPGWPELVWDGHVLAEQLAGVRHRQGLLLGKMSTQGFDLREQVNLMMLTSDVVKSSAIEGEVLPRDEVRSSIARRLGLDVGGLDTVAPGRHVEGIVEMMLDATQRFEAPLTPDRLFGWHAALFPTGYSGMRPIVVGRWRPKASGVMQVVSGPMGRERVHFEAPEAGRLEVEMSRFLDWFNGPASIDPVIKAGMAHFWFVTIHPFEDGNGRIARAIADMSLARADGIKDRFYSMSSQIEAERKEYYLRLETAQRGDLDITDWLVWFLGCLERSLQGAEAQLAGVVHRSGLWNNIGRRGLNERQQRVIHRMLDDFEGFLTTSKYARIAKCSTDTALRDIRELLELQVIVTNPGRGRSTSYRLAEPDTRP